MMSYTVRKGIGSEIDTWDSETTYLKWLEHVSGVVFAASISVIDDCGEQFARVHVFVGEEFGSDYEAAKTFVQENMIPYSE
jgi:hypothetical protein